MSKTRHPLRKICVRFYPRPCKHYFEPLSVQTRSLIGKWWHQLERGPKGATCCKKCVFVFIHDLVDTLSNHIRSKTGTRNKRELPTVLSWRNSKKNCICFFALGAWPSNEPCRIHLPACWEHWTTILAAAKPSWQHFLRPIHLSNFFVPQQTRTPQEAQAGAYS